MVFAFIYQSTVKCYSLQLTAAENEVQVYKARASRSLDQLRAVGQQAPADAEETKRKQDQLLKILEKSQRQCNEAFNKQRQRVVTEMPKMSAQQQEEFIDVMSGFTKFFSAIAEVLQSVVRAVVEFFKKAWKFIKTHWEDVKILITKGWEKVTSYFCKF